MGPAAHSSFAADSAGQAIASMRKVGVVVIVRLPSRHAPTRTEGEHMANQHAGTGGLRDDNGGARL